MVEVNDALSLFLSIYKYIYHDAFFVKSNSIHDVIIGEPEIRVYAFDEKVEYELSCLISLQFKINGLSTNNRRYSILKEKLLMNSCEMFFLKA